VNHPQVENLVFEGGGVKGIAYAGALAALERAGVMPGVKRVAGTSAGAIVAMLVAMGAWAAKVEEIVGGTSFLKFKDRDIFGLLTNFGLYKGDALRSWLEAQAAALGRAGATFESLPRDLTVIGTDLVAQSPVVFSRSTTPKMVVTDAVRISAGIPLFFAVVREDGGVFVDGGYSWNYPIDVFDQDEPDKSKTLGFKLAGDAQLPPRTQVNDIKDFIEALLNFGVDHLNQAHVHEADADRTVFIPTFGVRATQFDIDKATQARLVASGRAATEAWLFARGAAPAKEAA
jgi:NTE family protein